MEIRKLILSMALMMAIVLGWELVVNSFYKAHPTWAPATQPSENAPIAAAPTTAGAAEATAPTTGPAASGLSVIAAATTQPAMIGSVTPADPTFALGLQIDPAGAGLSSATLTDDYQTAERKNLYEFQQPLPNDESATIPLATREIRIDDKPVDLSRVNWKRTAMDRSSVTYSTVIEDTGAPLLQIDKTFQASPRNAADGSGGYEIALNQSFKNLSGRILRVQVTMNGPTLPPRENDRSEDRQFLAGYDDDKEVALGRTLLTEFTTSKPTRDLLTADKRPLLWVGAGSAYFNAIVRPLANPAVKIAAVPIHGVDLEGPAEQRSAAMEIQTSEFALAPDATAPLDLRVFLGPKQRSLLKNDYYSRFPLEYDQTLVISGGFCGFLTFAWLVSVLYTILAFFHFIFRDWGIAIICLVCLVRIALHPITKKAQVNMLRMGKMGPEVERLKKKHGDNKDELNKAMMTFYKEQGMAPVLGCLPMFLQTPIWIALWGALQSTFDLRQAGFLRFGRLHLTWINDLSRPDALVQFAHPIPLIFGMSLHGINVLPILMAGVFFIQQKVQPQPPATTPEQQQQRKMMQWMSLLFPVMLYPGPSGLNLYILTSTTIGIFESKIIRDHIKQREEAERAGRIIVDAKPTRAGKRKDKLDQLGKTAKPGGLMGWLADLQAKADQIRKERGN